MNRDRIRRWALAAALVSCAPAATPLLAQVVNDVYPLAPGDGETVGPRPHFRLTVDGEDLYQMRFRIVLSQDEFETEAYVFDQLEEPNGWAYENWDGAYGAIYMARKPIADGDYEWKVAAWNGVDWVQSRDVHRLRVDGIRPGDVEVYLSHAGDGAVRLEWDPVFVDVEGNSENVARYHVYRWTNYKTPMMMSMWELAQTEGLEFVDDTELARSTSRLYYRVTAEDLAGNHERFKLRVDPSGEDVGERHRRLREQRGGGQR